MVVVHGNRLLMQSFEPLMWIAENLAIGLGESAIYVVAGERGAYEFYFDSHAAYFSMSEVSYENGELECLVKLIDNGIVVFSREEIGITDMSWFARYAELIRYDMRRGEYSWESSVEQLKPVFIRDDIALPDNDPELDKFTSYGDDFRKNSGEYRVVGLEAISGVVPRSFSSDSSSSGVAEGVVGGFLDPYAEHDSASGGGATDYTDPYAELDTENGSDGLEVDSFEGKLSRATKSIVPDGIREIRVVALKYNGQVIAFRFKTDKGVFDMWKSVAAKYGLGEFKTETFITLESVNGVLMSKSERERRRCVPDISDSPEDCAKLIDRLFG